MIAIPNMDKPKSCDKCPIRIAELFGVYYDSKDGKSKRIKITGCDSSKYNGKTIAEEEKMMHEHCPLIEIDLERDIPTVWYNRQTGQYEPKGTKQEVYERLYKLKNGERRSDERE